MTLEDLLDQIDVQAQNVHYCYYDEDKDQLVERSYNELRFYRVKYIYPSGDNDITIEVEKE